MIPNPTDEIKSIRRKLAAQFENDVYRIGEELRRLELASGRSYLKLPKRQPVVKQVASKP
jgi:hypothetical protein